MSNLAVALGLVFAPVLGSSVGEAFNALGPDAVFGPGCLDGSEARTIQAPARWRTKPPAIAQRLGSMPLTVVAELTGNTVTSVHLAGAPRRHMTAEACRAQMGAFPGRMINTDHIGTSYVFEKGPVSIEHYPARYRAVFRPLRAECRIMLTIGA